ncbi:prenyltransferase/squalene oxidase repeat-containing protein [Fontivita pretiosa]|uniref:prenyltransferase/squalene oxidase repeat-containing protein n=1 Tax=Fontivita pretiosa TaxID=2989684 RepID=UPI003D187316
MRRITRVCLATLSIMLLIASTTLAQQTAPASPQQRAQALIDRGLDYLKAQQKPDGGWQGDRDPPGITAIVLRAFVQDPKYSADTDFVKRGYEKLLSYQLEDGGIYKDLLASYNTAIAISALSAAQKPEFKDRIDRAVAYLKGLQWTDMTTSVDGEKLSGPDDPWYGGWGYGGRSRGGGRPDLSNAQMALDALHDAGLKPDDPAFQAALRFVTRLQNFSETNDQPWAGNDGGFVYGPSDNRRGESMAGEYTTPDGQRRLRSYGSMTYAGLKSFIYAGLSKDDPRVRAAWDWITRNWTLDENPGMRAGNPDNARQGLYYYYHTLARALNEYDQPIITDPQGNQHDWRVELIDRLASLQRPDGSWVGEKRWMEDNPILVTAYVVLALQEAQKDLAEHPPQ